jgi:hypothetical protein
MYDPVGILATTFASIHSLRVVPFNSIKLHAYLVKITFTISPKDCNIQEWISGGVICGNQLYIFNEIQGKIPSQQYVFI